ncbi:MAG: protein-L-isoaspartate(D-aspartate) O-methyltransferase [Sedimentisphaerales bacterium]|nr:protein-L-isoaspartate(D-aspartate) O-methyltransferase [Sedimentisphaerales bacterium]
MINPSNSHRHRGVWVAAFLFWAVLQAGCDRVGKDSVRTGKSRDPHSDEISAASMDPNGATWFRPRSAERTAERAAMVEHMRKTYGMDSPTVLDALQNVPRHWFIPPSQQPTAYQDRPLLIGFGQTISQPFIVAYMTDLLKLQPHDRVLEIGTGSGYQAAVLYEFTPYVYTMEIIEPLARQAIRTFRDRDYERIQAKIGDGYQGWPEAAPFDAIIVTCAPDHIPDPLVEQLAVGGRMMIPVGDQWGLQELILAIKQADGSVIRQSKMPVRFVPLTR